MMALCENPQPSTFKVFFPFFRRYISPPAVLEHECTDNADNLTCGEDDGSAFREESECVGRNEQQLYPARHPDRGPHPQGTRKRRKRLEPPGTKQRLTEVQLKKITSQPERVW